MKTRTLKQEQWHSYCTRELAAIVPMLAHEGYTLNETQPHIMGERALLSGPKLVLLGKRIADGVSVVIKVTSNEQMARELTREHECLTLLDTINFAYHTFAHPEELLLGRHEQHTFLITRYIEQDTPFLARPLEVQFFLAIKAFEAQEGAHMVTAEHMKAVQRVYEIFDADRYLERCKTIVDDITQSKESDATKHACAEAYHILQQGKLYIERYNGFLTHWDFVPHNIRVRNDTIFLLDHTALRFGNKYDGWARFLNFMTLYNPELEKALVRYVKENRREEEGDTLRLMRLYRAGELIHFYTQKKEDAEGNLRKLTEARIAFWTHVLTSLIKQVPVNANVRATFIATRDTLRSPEEKKRQQSLH